MNLESLANEVILDLFEYLDGVDLLRAFHGLNIRFDRLLLAHGSTYQLDFRRLSKSAFESIIRHSLPSLMDRIVCLKLADDDETPNLPDVFLSSSFVLNNFTHLQSLTLHSIRSCDQLNQFITHCRDLPLLTDLSILDGQIDDGKPDLPLLWSLPHLRRLHLECTVSDKTWLMSLTAPSSSIEHLSIENTPCTLTGLSYLLRRTPHLRHLSATVHFIYGDEHVPVTPSSITSLKLTFESSVPTLIKLFQMVPNLRRCSLQTMDVYMSGTKWRKLLTSYLPHLTDFHMRMYFEFRRHRTIDVQLEKLIQSFRHPFWIEQHRWFVQCDCIPFGPYHHGVLYTLPYTFDTYISYNTQTSRRSCPNDPIFCSHARVHTLQHLRIEESYADLAQSRMAQFPNLHHLAVAFPPTKDFHSLVPSLPRLRSLEAIVTDGRSLSELQAMIDCAPALYSLTLSNSTSSPLSLGQLVSPSIRHLSFISKLSASFDFFDRSQCDDLAGSPLGQRCEVLLVKVEHRSYVLHLIQAMNNLRSLVFQCRDDTWCRRDPSTLPDELVQWLRISLPSTCSISRAKSGDEVIRIWIK